VTPIELLQRSDSEELPFEAKAEERDRRIDEAVHVECVDVLRRGVEVGEREVALQQLTNVLGSRVVNRDLALRHRQERR
jgi:hypothetical protein